MLPPSLMVFFGYRMGINCGYWFQHRSKDCSEAHCFPSEAFRRFGQQGFSKEPPTAKAYTLLQLSDLLESVKLTHDKVKLEMLNSHIK